MNFPDFRRDHADKIKQLEHELDLERNLASSLLDSLPALVLVLDKTGRIYRFNRACEAFTGYRALQVKGKHPWELFPDQNKIARLLKALFEQLPADQEFRQYHSYWPDREGQPRFILWSENLVHNREGDLEYIISTGLDVTEHKRKENELSADNRQLNLRMEQLSRYLLEIQLLNNMGRLLQGCQKAEEAYSVVTQFMPSFFPGMRGFVGVRDQDDPQKIQRVATWNDSGETPSRQGLRFLLNECQALGSRQIQYREKKQTGEACRNLALPLPIAYLCIPLEAQNQILGVFHVAQPRKTEEELDSVRRELAERVAEHLALALYNIKLREVLHKQSIHDPLTGLFNRRYLEWALEQELERAGRHGFSVGVVMLDLDHFKRFNDHYGHAAGDKVLRSLGVFLQRQVRKRDIVCRYGGEEFTLIIPNIDADNLYNFAERVREQIKKMRVSYQNQSLEGLSLSLGAALFPQHGQAPAELLHAADKALYRAKEAGRDRVVGA